MNPTKNIGMTSYKFHHGSALVKINISNVQGDYKMKPVKNPKRIKRKLKSLKHTALTYLLVEKHTLTYFISNVLNKSNLLKCIKSIPKT